MTTRHRTYRGSEFNMSAFAEKNADARAVGNVPMNARGDIVDSKGNVKITAGQISQGLSAVNNKKVTQVSLKQDAETAPVKNAGIKPDAVQPAPSIPDIDMGDTQTEENIQVSEIGRRIIETTEGDMIEIEYSDGSMEIVKIDRESNGTD